MPFKRAQLRYFVMVAEEGQITRAAVRLNIAQPALSQSITNLEGQVGFKLLERHAAASPSHPRERRFWPRLARSRPPRGSSDRTVDSMARAVAGTIAFGYTALPPWQIAPELIEAFALEHPEVKLDLTELGFPVTPASSWLADVDVMLVSPLTSDPQIWVEPLLCEPRALVVSSSHPLAGRSEVTVAEVREQTFIGARRLARPSVAVLLDVRQRARRPAAAGEPPALRQRTGALRDDRLRSRRHRRSGRAGRDHPERSARGMRDTRERRRRGCRCRSLGARTG